MASLNPNKAPRIAKQAWMKAAKLATLPETAALISERFNADIAGMSHEGEFDTLIQAFENHAEGTKSEQARWLDMYNAAWGGVSPERYEQLEAERQKSVAEREVEAEVAEQPMPEAVEAMPDVFEPEPVQTKPEEEIRPKKTDEPETPEPG